MSQSLLINDDEEPVDSTEFLTADEEDDDKLLNGDDEQTTRNDGLLVYDEHHFTSHNVYERRPLLSEEDDNTVFSREEEFFTVEDAVENMGFGRFQLRIWFICGLFSATDALEMLLLSVLSPLLRCEWILSELSVAFITTVVFMGMWIGSYLWGAASDKYGRHTVMMIACVWILYFGLLTSFSPNYWFILLLRSTVGFGFGGALQSFTLQSEYLPSKYRAKVLILNNIMWATGSCFEVLMAYLIVPVWGWRWLVAASALPMIITFFFVWTLPESARYLVAAGRKAEATDVLIKASRMNGKSIPKGRLIQSQESRRGSFRDLLSKEYLRTTLSVWLLWFGTAFSYYGMVLAQSEILEFHKTCGSAAVADDTPMTEECHCNLLNRDDYKQMIIATFGEFVVLAYWSMNDNLRYVEHENRNIKGLQTFLDLQY